MQFKWRKSTADLLRGHIMWRIFQVDFFVTDSVVPQPAKTILIILYCILVTIAGEHHTIATIAIIIIIIIDTISIIIITKIEIISFANSSLPAQSSAFQVFLPITINISSAASFPSFSETKIPHSFFIIDHVVDCSMQCRRWWQMEHKRSFLLFSNLTCVTSNFNIINIINANSIEQELLHQQHDLQSAATLWWWWPRWGERRWELPGWSTVDICRDKRSQNFLMVA